LNHYKMQMECAEVSFKPAQMNAIRAAFKVGITPSLKKYLSLLSRRRREAKPPLALVRPLMLRHRPRSTEEAASDCSKKRKPQPRLRPKHFLLCALRRNRCAACVSFAQLPARSSGVSPRCRD
jgi:hypothetical protein